MSTTQENRLTAADIARPRWKDLYTIGGVCGVLMTALTLIAIGIYFIWPYQPGLTSPTDIFSTIQNNQVAGLMSLDFFMVVITLITIPFFLALYVAVKEVNESYALLGVVFGMVSCIVVIPVRPIAEMFYLSAHYQRGTSRRGGVMENPVPGAERTAAVPTLSRRRFLRIGCLSTAAVGLTVCGVSTLAGEKGPDDRLLVTYASFAGSTKEVALHATTVFESVRPLIEPVDEALFAGKLTRGVPLSFSPTGSHASSPHITTDG